MYNRRVCPEQKLLQHFLMFSCEGILDIPGNNSRAVDISVCKRPGTLNINCLLHVTLA